MKEVTELLIGERGALVKVCDTPNKYELCSCWCYNRETKSWGQGHYFTLWGNEITEENKKELYKNAKEHFVENYL